MVLLVHKCSPVQTYQARDHHCGSCYPLSGCLLFQKKKSNNNKNSTNQGATKKKESSLVLVISA